MVITGIDAPKCSHTAVIADTVGRQTAVPKIPRFPKMMKHLA